MTHEGIDRAEATVLAFMFGVPAGPIDEVRKRVVSFLLREKVIRPLVRRVIQRWLAENKTGGCDGD